MKVINQSPDSEDGKKLLAKIITEAISQEDNDWFCLRLNIKTNPDDLTIQSVYVGTGWKTPQWAEFGDRGPTFAEKQQFQEVFNACFRAMGISSNPTTPEAVAEFFRYFITIHTELSRYFLVIRH